MSDALIRVRVTPRSGRDEVVGWQDGMLRVRVRSAPVEGQANEALRRLIAKRAGVPPSAVEVVGGATSRTKSVRIAGLSEAEAKERLGSG